MPAPRILSVGQCGLDHASLTRALGQAFAAQVTAADTHAEALRALRGGPFDLVLVNRIGDRDGARGLDLIRTLKADSGLASLPVMLVSNYPEAQAEAVELGALPGFGKSALGEPRTRELLAAALGAKDQGQMTKA